MYEHRGHFLPVVTAKIQKAAGDGEEDPGSRERDYGGRCGPLCDVRAPSSETENDLHQRWCHVKGNSEQSDCAARYLGRVHTVYHQ